MAYRIALNFEDGVTRFVEANEGETVLDAAFRQKVNLPMDCSDGVCGTCKCRAESGSFEMGDDYIDEALTEDEAAEGLVLTCQMVAESDCVLSVPVASTACKIAPQAFEATVAAIEPHEDAAVVLELDAEAAPDFLPGQYVNIDVPGSGLARSYSFSSAPGEGRMQFLIKKIPDGVMGTWLSRARTGDVLNVTGPMGSFYLRGDERPLLFLAGGTGLAPFLSMLEVLAHKGSEQRIHLVYGVTRDLDLVLVEALEAYAAKLPGFTFATVVAEDSSTHERKGWVTQHMPGEMLKPGEFDAYLCGPPPMVDAVRSWFSESGIQPASFHYEKFTPNAVLKATA
ncbi:benzoate 1,2-dioxygenase electron transfer component BenC [Mangrovicoccus sp. HB161399]|uniref:benzoate 1,2-dioxygenase electron transfer component BenC n=1 Tax=Mangrovicoccus sp. HB161399 TaxID=2720392 RepID=UPI001552EA7C|nr:benzoate 1,2-dioxygenase electron transfer component BenC [Mangrovicoccus sp. HB161399]